MRHCVRLVRAFLFAIILLHPQLVRSEPRAEQVMAALLFNFAKFVDWSTVQREDPALVFGVLEAPKLAEELSKIAKARGVGGRSAVVRTFSSPEELGPADAVFIGTSNPSEIRKALRFYSSQPTLTLGSNEGFIDEGGIIEFVERTGKIRFEINTKRAEELNLSISSGLVALADRVVR